MYSSILPLTSALDGVYSQSHVPTAFVPGKTQYPLYRGWVGPGPVWACAEKLTPTWFRYPEHPARSESLYRLRYPSPIGLGVIILYFC